MNSREEILKSLESALSESDRNTPLPPPPSGKEIFSDYPHEDLPGVFFQNLLLLRGEGTSGESMEELAKFLGNIFSTLDPGVIYGQDLPLLRAIVQRISIPQTRPVLWRSDSDIGNKELASSVAAITSADAFIARTGSVALRSSTAGGRRLSVLPPVHIVIGNTSQVRPSLENWYSEVAEDPSWSFGTVISGPSRTGDIEKILVLGAHGPKRLIVLLLNDLRSRSVFR